MVMDSNDTFGQVPVVSDPEASYRYAPTDVPTLSDEDRAAAEAREQAAKTAASHLADIDAAKIVPPQQRKVWRAFVSPEFPHAKFLVKPGPMVSFPDPNSEFGQRDVRRVDISNSADVTARRANTVGEVMEKWAVFAGGVLTTDDPDIIKWCEEHDGFHRDGNGALITAVCMDANDTRTAGWFNLRKGQLNLADREPSFEPGTHVGAMLFPEKAAEAGIDMQGQDLVLSGKDGGVVDAARRMANQMNDQASHV